MPESLSSVKVDHELYGSQTAGFVLFKSTLRAKTLHKIVKVHSVWALHSGSACRVELHFQMGNHRLSAAI